MKKTLSMICLIVYLVTGMGFSVAFAESYGEQIKIETDQTAAIFYDNDAAEFAIKITNTAKQAVEYRVKYEVIFKNYNYDSYKENVDEVLKKSTVRENVPVSKTKSFTDTLCIDLSGEKYGLYTLKATVTDAAGGVVAQNQMPFAKSTVSEKLSKTYGAGVHLTRYADPNVVFELMKNAGLGLARDDFNWSKYELSEGEYALSESQVSTLKSARKYGIDMLAILTGYNSLYSQNATYPTIPDDSVYDAQTGKTYADAYKNYVASFVSEPLVKNTVSMVEVMNEPAAVVPGGLAEQEAGPLYVKAGKAYAKATAAAYDAVKETNPNIKVGAFSTFRIGYEADYFIDGALSNMNKQYYDAFTIHDYKERGTDGDPEPGYPTESEKNWYPHLDGAVATIKHFDDLMCGNTQAPYTKNKYTAFSNKERWYTERGYSTDDKPGDSNVSKNPYYDQALNLVRSKIVTDAYNNGTMTDKTWIYDFSDDPLEKVDNSIRESSFGITESYTDAVPYAAKPAYIAVANYNSLVADATKCEKVDGDDINEAAGDYIYKYTCPEREVYIPYHTKGGEPAQICELAFERIGSQKEVHVYDFWGNEIDENDIYQDGKYQLTKQPYYICVGTPVNRNATQGDTNERDIITIEGKIASGQSGKRVSLVVVKSGEELSIGNITNAIALNQMLTDEGGSFSFECSVPKQNGPYKAYVTSEDCDIPVVFDIMASQVKKINISLLNGMIKLKSNDLKMVDLSNLSAIVEYSTVAEQIPYQMYCALYKNNVCLHVTNISDRLESMSSGNNIYPMTFAGDNGENVDFDKVMLFMFDGNGALRPLCSAYTVKE
ncbi:MAG: hypothetical protein PUF72_01600 [Clostridiales bacterium]|nr:hypothetical protein [Clostridiales bacterium]